MSITPLRTFHVPVMPHYWSTDCHPYENTKNYGQPNYLIQPLMQHINHKGKSNPYNYQGGYNN